MIHTAYQNREQRVTVSFLLLSVEKVRLPNHIMVYVRELK